MILSLYVQKENEKYSIYSGRNDDCYRNFFYWSADNIKFTRQ